MTQESAARLELLANYGKLQETFGRLLKELVDFKGAWNDNSATRIGLLWMLSDNAHFLINEEELQASKVDPKFWEKEAGL